MKALYSVAGISKQGLHQHIQRQETKREIELQVVQECSRLRSQHRRMSCKKMYLRSSVPVGRDKFEQIGFAHGYRVKTKRNRMKTTWGQSHLVHPNLIEGQTFNGLNQVWQSDIFYLKVENEDYYGVTIMDVYSRKLLAVNLSQSLYASQTTKALGEAIKMRGKSATKGCIFHSDRGSQYISDEVQELLKQSKMDPSMCKLAQENAYVERVQGTLKYEYLFEMTLTQANIHKQIKQIMYLYNAERPHAELRNRTPNEFENEINKLCRQDCPKLEVYRWKHPLLTEIPFTNKKEKRSKKEKSYSSINH